MLSKLAKRGLGHLAVVARMLVFLAAMMFVLYWASPLPL